MDVSFFIQFMETRVSRSDVLQCCHCLVPLNGQLGEGRGRGGVWLASGNPAALFMNVPGWMDSWDFRHLRNPTVLHRYCVPHVLL